MPTINRLIEPRSRSLCPLRKLPPERRSRFGAFVMKNLAFSIGTAALICGVATIASGARDEGRMPDLDGAVAWLNSPPLSNKSLRGKVVLVNFWTYSCINSLRELPYVKAWAAKYKDAGLVVIGVHSPEFGFEKDPANVRTAVSTKYRLPRVHR